MKIKALDSFSASEVGMVHAGAELDVSGVSETRLEEWRAKGFIPKELVEVLRGDGPTVAEFVAAGYRAEHYPPAGYASRSTEVEIAAALAPGGAPLDLTREGIGKMSKADVTELLQMHGIEANSSPVAKLREMLANIVILDTPEA